MELQNENERSEVDLNGGKGKEMEKGGITLSDVIAAIAVVIAVMAMATAVYAVFNCSKARKECYEANLAIAEFQDQVSKLEEASAKVDEPLSENEEAIPKLNQDLAELGEISSEIQEDFSELQNDVASMEEKLSEHDASISALQGKASKMEEASSKNDGAISGIQDDIAKANDRINKAESRITEVEKKSQTTSGSGDSSAQKDTSKKDDKKEDDENKYSKGVDCMFFYDLRIEVKRAYKSDAITYEQLKKYVDSYLDMYNMAIYGSEISADEVNRYNGVLKDMSVINYDKYHIKSTGKDYLKGFSDKIRYNAYKQVVMYYHDKEKIPDDAYKEYEKALNRTSDSAQEKEITDTINHARRVINKYVDDPDKVMKLTEWRSITSVDTFLSYID